MAEPQFEGREVEEEMLEQLPAVVEPVSCWHGPLVAKPVSWWSAGADREGMVQKQEVR